MAEIDPYESIPLYESRKKIYPKAVKGFFRTFKWQIMIVTLTIYYVTPWIRWYRGEGQPDQAVLVDIANRRFYFFFIEIWPQEFFYIAALLVMAGIGLFLITSVVGRAWCGYFCPQTVWTDLFLHVERIIEGDRNAQMRLDRQGWTAEKIRKRVGKHAIWLAIAVMTGGAWVFYFTDAPALLRDLVTFNAPFISYAAIGVLTFTTYTLGGLMREQVCIYMCPWPRIQGAMLDEKSLVVTYNDWRGEPRGKHRKREGADTLGDCIDCNACVAVCPTGVDIREGQQIGCITCGLCIDACNAVMEKVDLPKQLISYSTLEDYDAKRNNTPLKTITEALSRPRTLVYGLIWAAIGVALIVSLLTRDRLDIAIEHDRNPKFVRLADGSIRNAFQVRILNMRPEPRVFEIEMTGLSGAVLSLSGAATETSNSLRVNAPADATHEIRMFVTQTTPTRGATDLTLTLRDLFGTEETQKNVSFFAPE